jgi:hypothetical protein
VPDASPEEAYLDALKGTRPPPPPEAGTKAIRLRSFLAHHDAHPFALDVLLLKLFGPQYFDWEWATIKGEIRHRFSSTISELNFNKIEAMRTLHRSDRAWSRWEVFEKVVQAINNNIPMFDRMQRCSLEQLWNGARIMGLVRKERFKLDVPRYVAAVFHEDSVWHCPGPLSFARSLVRQDPEVGRAFKAYDGKRPLEETGVDIQVAKLHVAKRYVEMRDSQLQQQLALIREAPAQL